MRHRLCHFRSWWPAALLTAAVALAGCARPHLVIPIRTPAELGPDSGDSVAWFGPMHPGDLEDLGRWRRAVGPPVVVAAPDAPRPADRLVVISWNVHVGAGDVARLIRDVREDAGGDPPIVLLLQEVYRRGAGAPRGPARSLGFASAIRDPGPGGDRVDVEAIASALGLHAYYVPSMRSGAPGLSDEDRGNAILSTLRLTELAAIELPFERQRRVAVTARIGGATHAGVPWSLRVVSAHLDTRGGTRRLWVAGAEYGRARQARGLVSALGPHAPTVLGADLNSWFGFCDAAYRTAAQAFRTTSVTDRRPTYGRFLRLDHLLFRLDDAWCASFRRAGDRYGSDHHPLIGVVGFTGSACR